MKHFAAVAVEHSDGSRLAFDKLHAYAGARRIGEDAYEAIGFRIGSSRGSRSEIHFFIIDQYVVARASAIAIGAQRNEVEFEGIAAERRRRRPGEIPGAGAIAHGFGCRLARVLAVVGAVSDVDTGAGAKIATFCIGAIEAGELETRFDAIAGIGQGKGVDLAGGNGVGQAGEGYGACVVAAVVAAGLETGGFAGSAGSAGGRVAGVEAGQGEPYSREAGESERSRNTHKLV